MRRQYDEYRANNQASRGSRSYLGRPYEGQDSFDPSTQHSGGEYRRQRDREYEGGEGFGILGDSSDRYYTSDQDDYDGRRFGYGRSRPGWRRSEFQEGSPHQEGSGWGQSSLRSARERRDYRTSSGRYSGRGPKNYRRSDDSIREEVCRSLEADGDVDASDIDVSCEDGMVTLQGSVPDRRMKRCAEECIDDLYGVKDVMNQLEVNRENNTTSDIS